VVVGYCAKQVKEYFEDTVNYAVQHQKLGTAHAVMQAEEYFKSGVQDVLVICGDTPLITSNTILETLAFHRYYNNSATIVSAQVDNPAGYGRIIRNHCQDVLKIVEDKDASPQEKLVTEINSGIYWFQAEYLIEALRLITNSNRQNEFYLTDVIEILVSKQKKVGAFQIDDPQEILGINDRIQLSEASNILKTRILNWHMLSGVTIVDPSNTYIEYGVQIGIDTIIYPNTIIRQSTTIGQDCELGPNTQITCSTLGNSVKVQNSVIIESQIEDDSCVGPFAYLRPGSLIGEKVKIGDFVEVKNTSIGKYSKVPHLSYVGDSEIGSNVNLGCGVITVNYDGKNKRKCIVEDDAFVGCNSNLIAPVKVGKGAYIAAGSTITTNVSPGALAIARSKQDEKEGWASRKLKK